MQLVDAFEKHVNNENLFTKGDQLLLAVSGGVDSIVLCELCKQTGYAFKIAHCNFQLRGEESKRDEEFVRLLAAHYHVEVFIKHFDTNTYATEKKISIQVAARELRYEWFHQLIENENVANLLLTAHHADDNAETIAMNFFRGTGMHGLTGIPAKSNHIRRPLLIFSKEELISFAKENSLSFVEDSSNSSAKYTRNLFRHEVLPLIEKVYPEVKSNLLDNINRFREIEKLYRQSLQDLRKKLCKQKNAEVHIPIRQLLAYNNRALIYELISPYDFTEGQVDEVLKLSESESGRYIQSPSGKYRLIRHRHWFIISPVNNEAADTIVIEEKDKTISFNDGQLKIKKVAVGKDFPTDNSIAALDANEISFPLLLRRWKQGDYFYPLGMKKKKKLSRFLIDQKLSRTDKEKVWVIEMNKKVVWIVGKRIDDRFKVMPKTKSLLEIRFVNS